MEKSSKKNPMSVLFEAAAWLAAGSFAVDSSNVIRTNGAIQITPNYLVFGVGIFLIISGLVLCISQIKFLRAKCDKFINVLLFFTTLLVFPITVGEFLRLAFQIFGIKSIVFEVIAIAVIFIFLISMIFVIFEDWITLLWDVGRLLQLTFAYSAYAFILYFTQSHLQAIWVFGISSIFTILALTKWDIDQKKRKRELRIKVVYALTNYLHLKLGA